jgi:hypothetical protein
MRVGFTGTREGCTPAQGGALARLICDMPITEFHHGCCLGADTEAVTHVTYHHVGVQVTAHPCSLRAFFSQRAYRLSNAFCDVKPPLDRNHDIVDACEVLIACPKESAEVLRSGTWATVRYARKKGLRVVLILPDGNGPEPTI